MALEEKIRSLDEQLRGMYNHRQSAEQQARRFEIETRDLEERLRTTERELTNGGVYRDGLRTDKEKVNDSTGLSISLHVLIYIVQPSNAYEPSTQVEKVKVWVC